MMKKLYFLLLFIAFSVTAFAQRSADFELAESAIGTSTTNATKIVANQTILYDGVTKYYLRWAIINHGPDSLKASDTLYLKSSNGVTYKGPGFTVGGPDTISVSPLPSLQTFKVPPGITPPLVVTIPWCDSIWIAAGPGNTAIVDPDMSNNYFCENITAQYAWAVGIYDLATNEDNFEIYPNPASGSISIKLDPSGKAKDARIVLRNTIGQTVYSRNLVTTTSVPHVIDISNLPPGLYTVELQNINQTTVKKLTIQ